MDARETFFVVQYEWKPEAVGRIRDVYPEHRARVDRMGAAGDLWLIGTLGELDQGHSIAAFRTRAAAEEFRAADPYVEHRLITTGPTIEWRPLIYPPT